MLEIPAECQLLLPHEDPDDYRRHVEGMIDSHQPQNAHEKWLVEEFAAAAWFYRRARAIEASFWENIGGSYHRGAAGVAEALFQEKEMRFRSYVRYRAQAEREYYKALAAVERMRADRDRRLALTLKAERTAGKSVHPPLEHAAVMSAGQASASPAPSASAGDPASPAGRAASSRFSTPPITSRESLKPQGSSGHIKGRSRTEGAARKKKVTSG